MANLVKNEIECLGEAWDALDEVIQSLTLEQLATLGRDRWTIKDHLAHIAWAEQYATAALKGEPLDIALGIDRESVLNSNDDELNELGYQLFRSHTEAQVLEMRERAHQALMDTLSHVTDDDLLKPFAPFGEPLGMRMLDILRGNTYEHYEAHRRWLDEIINFETRGA